MVNLHSRGKADLLVAKTFGERLIHGSGRKFAYGELTSQLLSGESEPQIYFFCYQLSLIMFGNRFISDIIRKDDFVFGDKGQQDNLNLGTAATGNAGDANGNHGGPVGGDSVGQLAAEPVIIVSSNTGQAQGGSYLTQFGLQ